MQNPHLQSDFPAHALRKRLRKAFVSGSFGFSNSSFGGLSSTITPFAMKITRLETSRANAISWCAIKATPDGKPDFSALLSYGNEAVMLEKLITETEKEMQAVRDAAKEKDLQKLDSLIHHLRSSWEVLRADQPLNVLYGLLRGDALPDGEALSHAVTAVLDKGVEIIRLAEEERRKYEDG